MTAAMHIISSILAQIKMTEQDTLAVKSKRNCVYRLLTVFQCLLLFPCFGIKKHVGFLTYFLTYFLTKSDWISMASYCLLMLQWIVRSNLIAQFYIYVKLFS